MLKEQQAATKKKPFVKPTLREEAALTEVTLLSPADGGGGPIF